METETETHHSLAIETLNDLIHQAEALRKLFPEWECKTELNVSRKDMDILEKHLNEKSLFYANADGLSVSRWFPHYPFKKANGFSDSAIRIEIVCREPVKL